jgi:hypothetical protein
MTVVVKFKDEEVEVLRGIEEIKDIPGGVLVGEERYLKKDIVSLEIIWR